MVKVDKNGPTQTHCPELGPCWVWTAARCSFGYGMFRLNKKTIQAHIVAYTLAYGPLPKGKPCVLHACDGGAVGCVRPFHLFPGTHSDNTRDKVMKGRQMKGRGVLIARRK